MKKITFVFYLFLLLGSANQEIYAQFAPVPCKDEMLADPLYNCGGDFRPVCACDNVTYHNECAAFRNAGIQGNQWNSGVCQEFFFYLYPVPAYGNLTLKMEFESKGGSATLLIMNMFGQVAIQRFISSGNNFPLTYQFDMRSLRPGFYIVTLYSNKYRQTQIIPVINE